MDVFACPVLSRKYFNKPAVYKVDGESSYLMDNVDIPNYKCQAKLVDIVCIKSVRSSLDVTLMNCSFFTL